MDPEKVSKNLAINVLFKARHPSELKLVRLNPTNSPEFGSSAAVPVMGLDTA